MDNVSGQSVLEQTIIKLKECDKAYYGETDEVSPLSDTDYDILVQLYKTTTGRDWFGYKNFKPLGDYQHKHFVQSLKKIYDIEELKEKIEPLLPVVITPKYDGITLVNMGSEISSPYITRGNGETGMNVSHNFNHLITSKFDVRGEAIIKKSKFELLKKNGYNNLRNSASGIASKKSKISLAEEIDFIAYDIFNKDDLDFVEKLEFIKSLGYTTTPYVICNTIEEVVNYINKTSKDDFQYEIDGLVIRAKSNKDFGTTSKYPKHSFAFKWKAEEIDTPILSIDWQVGRTGVLTPVLNVEPVELCNTIVSRVTASNYQNLKELCGGFPRKSAIATIRKSGEVIPYVSKIDNSKDAELFDIPIVCPYCGHELIKDDINLLCDNKQCSKRIREQIEEYTSILGIKGFSDATVEKVFIKYGPFIQYPCFIKKLKKEHFMQLEGFKDKSSSKLADQIEAVFKEDIELWKVLRSTMLDNIGSTTSKDLCKHFNSLNDILIADEKQLLAIDGIGEKTVETLKSITNKGLIQINHSFFDNVINTLYGSIDTEKKVTIYITGKFEMGKKELKKILEERNFKIVSSYSSKTDYLLVGENPGKAKLGKFPEKEKDLNFFLQ